MLKVQIMVTSLISLHLGVLDMKAFWEPLSQDGDSGLNSYLFQYFTRNSSFY